MKTNCRLAPILGGIACVALAFVSSCGGGSSGGSGSNAAATPSGTQTSSGADLSYFASPAATRNWLTVADLTAANPYPALPLHNGYFTQIGNSGSSVQSFLESSLSPASRWKR